LIGEAAWDSTSVKPGLFDKQMTRPQEMIAQS
jgi:hypothetical protein